MKKLISLILLICLTLTLFSCDEGGGNSIPSEPDPRFYVPTEQRIYSEDGELIFVRTFEFDENGFMCKVDTVYSGFRQESRHETVIIKNDFDNDALKLTQNISLQLEGSSQTAKMKYVWTLDKEMNVIGVTYFSQGEEYNEKYSVELSDFIWLNNDGSFPSIDGGEYPIPTASLSRDEESGIPTKLKITYSDSTLNNNAYVSKINADIASQYGEELVEYTDIDKYVAYHTLWGAISRGQNDGVITELKYENGTVAETIKWKNATPEEFVSFHLLDWDWFGGGALDFTVFKYLCTLNPPYKPVG